MNNKELREQKILGLKIKLAQQYLAIMCGVLIVFVLYFIFYVPNYFMIFYLTGGIISLFLFLLYFRIKKVDVHTAVMGYLVVAPVYNFIVMLQFWNYSVASFVWLVPIPIGAYIFFSLREVLLYSSYALLTIIAVALMANYVTGYDLDIPRDKIKYADIFLFAANIIIVAHLLYYRDKIRQLELITELEKLEKIELPVSIDEKELRNYRELFIKIEKLMTDEMVYKDPDFNISILSTRLKVNNTYVSRCIRQQDYANFNTYVNFYRINHVVKSIGTVDLEKLTMLYIYTEAGFKSQSTFNRAFKDIMGITPSEYIQKAKPVN